MSIVTRIKSRLLAKVAGRSRKPVNSLSTSPEGEKRTMHGLLQGLKRRGPCPDTIIDVGASDARWSYCARQFFPKANHLVIEAQAYHYKCLKAFGTEHPASRVVLAAAGAKQGQIHFDASDPFGGQASDEIVRGATSVRMTSIDHEILSSGFPGKYLIKLDTHGFEVPIIQGA